MTGEPSLPPRRPQLLGKFIGGTFHDWANTGFIGVLALLYVADCEGWELGSPGAVVKMLWGLLLG